LNYGPLTSLNIACSVTGLGFFGRFAAPKRKSYATRRRGDHLVHHGDELIDMPMSTASPEHTVMVEQKVVNLALQGGGSHGAFTWGVLDRLLEDERLSFEGITASSAGSGNAAVLAHGLAVGGRDEARRTLQRFWKRMSETSVDGALQPSLLDRMKGNFGLEPSPG
jgi:predicted acylesterase/phospholipase RssA